MPELPRALVLMDAGTFSKQFDGATVINTARGALIDHGALAGECCRGRTVLKCPGKQEDPQPWAKNKFFTPAAGRFPLVEDIRVERIEDTPLVHPPGAR